MAVHNHGPEGGAGLACNESRLPDGSIRGACMPSFKKVCVYSEPKCPNFFDVGWQGSGYKEASRKGWFIQQNGSVWCPDHIPVWVAEWRQKKKNNDSKNHPDVYPQVLTALESFGWMSRERAESIIDRLHQEGITFVKRDSEE